MLLRVRPVGPWQTNAYALVCPAMYVNDFALLPELVAKIGENKHLKAHFDKVYTTRWKPLLDPDF